MEFKKTAKKTMIISGTPDEMKKLAELNPKLARQINDARLPDFMNKVDQMFRDYFNMPGGMGDSIKEQIATAVRSGLQNSQSGSPLEGTEPPVNPEFDPMEGHAHNVEEGNDPNSFPALQSDEAVDSGADPYERTPEGGITNPLPLGDDVADGTQENLQDWQDRVHYPGAAYNRTNDQILDDGEMPGTTPAADKHDRLERYRKRRDESIDAGTDPMSMPEGGQTYASLDRNRKLTKASQRTRFSSGLPST